MSSLKGNTGLYFIRDRASGLMYSGFVPAQNDLVAVFGFINTLKKMEDSPVKVDPRCFALCKAGNFYDNGTIVPCDVTVIVNGDKAQEFYDNELVKALENEEDS